ncbi:Kinesin-like protein kif27 [Geranomyces variabilis]|uniref:Kinesin-like protein kif27 n=1 Tax=Geranomyces variabilis TaxID=109894 RepID=A0AAD5XIH0_9FUNG|nr:Kinesin-like protein kif27 [Geranomyces variabilis]
MRDLTQQQQQKGGFLNSVKRLFLTKRPSVVKSLSTFDQWPPEEPPRVAGPPRRQSDAGFSQGLNRRAVPPARDRLRRFSIDAADVARGRPAQTDIADLIKNVVAKKMEVEDRVASLPETLRIESRQESASSDVDNSALTVDASGSRSGSASQLSSGRRGSGPGWHGRNSTGTAPDLPHAAAGPSAEQEYIMTPGGQITVAEAREALDTPPQQPSPRALSLSESSSLDSGGGAKQETHEIMVGGELRTATIDELTTLVAFGVVLPTMMDFRKIGLCEAPSALRNERDSPTSNAGKHMVDAPAAQSPRNRSMRRNSMPASVARPTPASITLPRTPPPDPPRPVSETSAKLAPPLPIEIPRIARARRYSLPDPQTTTATASPPLRSQPGSQTNSGASSRRHSSTTASTSAIARELPDFERELNSRMTPAIFLAGEYVIRKREVGREMYFLSKGKVEVVSSDGKTVYSTIGPGSFFGELGVLFDIPRTASVRTLQNSFCMVLSRSDLQEVLKGFPSISARFEKVVAARMAEVRSRREMALLSKVRINAAFSTIQEEEE